MRGTPVMRSVGPKPDAFNAERILRKESHMKRDTALPVQDMQKHIVDLGRAFSIRVIFDTAMTLEESYAARLVHVANPHQTLERRVFVPPIESDILYGAALHELGHHLHPSGQLRTIHDEHNYGLMLTEEESAWEWAEHYALCWTPAMRDEKELRLGNYRKRRIETERLRDQHYRTLEDVVRKILKGY